MPGVTLGVQITLVQPDAWAAASRGRPRGASAGIVVWQGVSALELSHRRGWE